MLQVDPVVMVTDTSAASLPLSDHNTQQTHSTNSDSNAEEDIQVLLSFHWEALFNIYPFSFCLIFLKGNESLFH